MKLKKNHTNHDSWYLYDLVVRQNLQRQGIGTSILNPMLKYISRSGEGCYLETHNAVNIEIYKKFGFDLVETGIVPQLNIDHYAMLKKF